MVLFLPIVDLVLSSSANTLLSWSIFAIMRSISDGKVDALPAILCLLILIESNTSPAMVVVLLIVVEFANYSIKSIK